MNDERNAIGRADGIEDGLRGDTGGIFLRIERQPPTVAVNGGDDNARLVAPFGDDGITGGLECQTQHVESNADVAHARRSERLCPSKCHERCYP